MGNLEPQGAHEVNHSLAATRSCDSTKALRIKLRVAIAEVGVVEGIDERGLDFKAHRLPNREALGETEVRTEEPTTIDTVHREIAKRTWRRLTQQSLSEC